MADRHHLVEAGLVDTATDIMRVDSGMARQIRLQRVGQLVQQLGALLRAGRRPGGKGTPRGGHSRFDVLVGAADEVSQMRACRGIDRWKGLGSRPDHEAIVDKGAIDGIEGDIHVLRSVSHAAAARIICAALAPIICDGALVLPVVMVGMIELSQTRRPSTP